MLCLPSYAQTPEDGVIENLNELIKAKIQWSTVSRNTFLPSEKNHIVKMIKDSTNTFCNEYWIEGSYLEDFHLPDLDSDGDLDVVYEGFECAGLSSKTVLIYLNKNNEYEKVLDMSGRIMHLNPGKDFTIYKYPCCAEIENTVINFKVRNDSSIKNFGFNFFFSPILKPLSKDYESIIPKKLKHGKHYTVKANSRINYVPQDSLETPVFISKSLYTTINTEAPIKSYATVTDKKGIKWLYCSVPKKCISLNDKNIEYPLLIWIKQEDCIDPNK